MSALPDQEGQSFWEQLGPGMLRAGVGFFGQRAKARQGEANLRTAQGPLYNQLMGQAGQSLSLAGSMDPQKMAAERFTQQQALLAPEMEADRQNLMRVLQKQGLLGVASFSPVPNTVATPGVAMNPHLAALYAAQERQKAESAYKSLNESQRYLDDLLRRSGMLQTQAQGAQATGQAARAYMPSKPSAGSYLLEAGRKMLNNPADARKVAGMLGQGFDWLKQQSPWSTPPIAPSYSVIEQGYQDWDAY